MTKLQPKARGDSLREGCWYLNQDAEVKVCCPGCGGVGDLNEHRIDDNGMVWPSLICQACGFHDSVQLEGWIVSGGG